MGKAVEDIITRISEFSGPVLEMTKKVIGRTIGMPLGQAMKVSQNIYLNELDWFIHQKWMGLEAKVRVGRRYHKTALPCHITRYADDFVVLAKQMGSETIEFIESRLERKFQLEINREKTRVVDLREEGASPNFLGYTFRYDRDLKGRDRKYLNAFPSNKAVQREREKLREMTNRHHCHKPIPVLIGELNRHLRGWANYFSFGYPTSAYSEIERHVQGRLVQNLRRRSQRPYRPPPGESWLRHLARLGLRRLSELVHA